MHTTKNEPERSDKVDDTHRCTLYLLGELSSEETAGFEDELAQSPRLGDQLQRQAELILAISETQPIEPQVTTDHRSSWTWVASLLAVAASLVLVFLGVRSFEPESTTVGHISTSQAGHTDPREELLIAQAWVGGLSNEQGELSVENGFTEVEHDDVLPLTVLDDAPENDSALSWMFAAISTDLASLETPNDG